MAMAALGNPADTASASSENREQRRARQKARRKAAWIIRSLTETLMPRTRWADCGNPVGAHVEVKELDETGVMQPAKIATCASPWACLSCAAKIRAQRALEIDHVTKAHLAAGGGVTFLTFTFPHELRDSLEKCLDTVTAGWRSLVSGAVYAGVKQEDGTYIGGARGRWGIVGNIRAVEITDGLTFGWHPHLHVLCFHDRPLSPEDGSLQEFRAWWSNRWANWIKRTLSRDIHAERGVDAVVVRDRAGIGEYVSKIHFELVRGDLKDGRRKNRTPWQIALDAAETGDKRDMARWVEYCEATKRKWLVTGLAALRKLYGMPPEMSDEDAASQAQQGTVRVCVDGRVWRRARRYNRRAVIADALAAYEAAGINGMLRIFQEAMPDQPLRIRRRWLGPPMIEPADDRPWHRTRRGGEL